MSPWSGAKSLTTTGCIVGAAKATTIGRASVAQLRTEVTNVTIQVSISNSKDSIGLMMRGAELLFLSQWQNFYMLIGTAAATLTGLMFVAITLVAGLERHGSTLDAGVSAFSTPTVVHFCAVLLIAGILNAPWQTFFSVRL